MVSSRRKGRGMVDIQKVFSSIWGLQKEDSSKSPLGRIEPSFIRETGTFSQRIGAKRAEEEVQSSSMDGDLRNSLWNVVVQHFLPPILDPYSVPVRESKEFFVLIQKLWFNFFKLPADRILYDYVGNAINELRDEYMELRWNEVYDFVEFLIQNNDEITSKPQSDLVTLCNNVLERESSYFRIIDKRVTPRKG